MDGFEYNSANGIPEDPPSFCQAARLMSDLPPQKFQIKYLDGVQACC